jgi:hypothetical protein
VSKNICNVILDLVKLKQNMIKINKIKTLRRKGKGKDLMIMMK